MANKGTVALIQGIIDKIKANGTKSITGTLLQTELINVIQSRGLIEKYQPTKIYEQNEFISYNDNIYITIAVTIAGETPDSHPAKFVLQGSGGGGISAAIVTYAHLVFTNVQDALDDHDAKINALIPAPPANLAGRSLVMALYTAVASGTGTSHQCTDDTTPQAEIADVYNADAGDLTAEIDTVADGVKTLTAGDDSGTYSSLIIVNESDPLQGEIGQGIYKVLLARIISDTALSLAQHTYRLVHSITGASALLTFNVDDPGLVTISAVFVTLPVSVSRYVSGVPSLSQGDDILLAFTVEGAVGKHYHPTKVANLSGLQVSSLDIAPPASTPAEGADLLFVDKEVNVLAAVYSEDIIISIFGYNSKAVAGTINNHATGARVDLVSNETNRRTSGSGQYPASGYGASFDPEQDLKTVYTEELQQLNGIHQWPAGNFSGNLPVAGPDYSSGMGTGWRYVVPIAAISLNNASGFTINFIGAVNFSGVETPDIRIYIKVDGATGWIDANASYPGVGSPVNNGDPSMVYNQSSATVKRVTFGPTPRTGLLYIRIGLPSDTTKKFQTITVTNIV